MHLVVTAAWIASLVGSLAACTGQRPTAEPPPGFEVVVPQDRYADVNGVRLHYLDWGGEGDLFVLVPGLSHTAHTWNGIAPAFIDRFRVVSVTRRWHGASGRPDGPLDLQTLVDDLDAFVALFPNRPVILAGQSYAGLELPRFAKRHPGEVRALIFLDAVYDWPGWLETGPPFPGFYEAADSYDSYDALFAWFAGLYPEMWHDSSRAHLVSQTYVAPDGTVRWQFPVGGTHWARFLKVEGAWAPAEYEGLDMPILSIQAEQGGFMAINLRRAGATREVIDTANAWATDLDNVLKQRGRNALAAAAPHAVMIHYADTHHWLHLQSPQRVIRSINEFLGGLR